MRTAKRYTNATFTRRVDHLAGRHRGTRTPPGPDVCRVCGAAFVKRHWVAAGTAQALAIARKRSVVLTTCDACRMIAQGAGRGEVRVSGDYFAAHRDEVEHLLRNVTARALLDNPLARIVRWTPRGKQELTILTTTESLAQRLGRELKKTFHGAVHYEFSHENKFAHVTWTR